LFQTVTLSEIDWQRVP